MPCPSSEIQQTSTAATWFLICPNRLVHLLTVNGRDSGALFAYRKNMKSIQRVVDTRELVTRLYAVGAEGMTFADINGGKAYVEDFTYTNEVRISTLDCSSFTNPYQMKEYAEMRLADYAKLPSPMC